MKKIKFIVAIVGITLATFGSVKESFARQRSVKCVGGGSCGTTPEGYNISGSVSHV